jgi:hypothetical protein
MKTVEDAEETVELLLALNGRANPVDGPPHPLSPTVNVNEPYDPALIHFH